MLYLGPVNDKTEVEKYFSGNGLPYCDKSGCVTCKDGEDILGYCLYTLDNEKMVILHLVPEDDLALADGILRSTLHIAAERSIMDAFYGEAANENLFKKLCFIENPQEKRLAVDKLFKSCCGCEK